MSRRPSGIYKQANYRRVCCIGDSLTRNFILGVPSWQHWPYQLQLDLIALGCPVLARNYGISGQMSSQINARIGAITQYEIPDLAIVFAGQNDVTAPGSNTGAEQIPAAGLSCSGTTATATFTVPHGLVSGTNMTLSISGATPAGYNVTNSAFTVTSPTTFTYTVSAGSNLGTATGTIYLGSFSSALTTGILQAMVASLIGAGVSRVLLCSTPYVNAPTGSGGFNTGSSPYITPFSSLSSLNATIYNLWEAQYAAYTAAVASYPGKVAWCDLYTGLYNVLNANASLVYYSGGPVTWPWNVPSAAPHFNLAGAQVVASTVLAAIQAAGWQSALSA